MLTSICHLLKNSMRQVLLEKLTVAQLAKNLPDIYETRKSLQGSQETFTTHIISYMNAVYFFVSYFCKVHLM
jgi:hypothetical protein